MKVKFLDGFFSGEIVDVAPCEYIDLWYIGNSGLSVRYHVLSDGTQWVGTILKGN